MKYKLLKDLPLAKAGTKVELKDDGIHYAIIADEMIDFVTLGYILSKDIPEWLEEIKEPKTIYDLKTMDTYWGIQNGYVEKYAVLSCGLYPRAELTCFLTEREAKRNKLLRELATRMDKWLPEKGERYYTYNRWGKCFTLSFNDGFDISQFHMGFVFKSEEEYNKYITEESKDLLFNI